jgi:PPOX class probable F420-dependent enzyme
MDVDQALLFAHGVRRGVLTTLRRDGRAQLSNIMFGRDGEGRPIISVTDDRAKTANMRRDARVALHVTDDTFWQYVVLDGTATLSPPAADPHDATVEALIDYYRQANGEHDDWDDYRRAMVAERRLVATLTVTSAYGILH